MNLLNRQNLKWILVAAIAVYGCVGLSLIIVGSLWCSTSELIEPFTANQITTINYIFIAVGAAAVLISAFGVVAALYDKAIFIRTYIGVMIFTLLFQLGLLEGSYQFLTLIPIELRGRIKKKYNCYEESTTQIDQLQMNFKCCSPFGVHSWAVPDFPPSCCGKRDDNCSIEETFSESCYDTISHLVKYFDHCVGYGSLLMVLVELICICIAIGLAVVTDEDAEAISEEESVEEQESRVSNR